MFHIQYENDAVTYECDLHSRDASEAERLAMIFVNSYKRHGGQIFGWRLVRKG